ncbi:MAG: hypothetical protein V7641_1718 [Blastocatellia bacterium]
MRHSHISRRRLVGLVLAICSLTHTLGLVGWSAGPRAAKREEKAARLTNREVTANAKASLAATFGNLPVSFIENRGQLDRRVAYYVEGSETAAYFTSTGVTFALLSDSGPAAPQHESKSLLVGSKAASTVTAAKRRWALKLDFIGANPHAQIEAHGQAPGSISYFRGAPSQWHAGLRSYARLVYKDLWPGIDLVYAGQDNHLKYSFIVTPGAEPAQIKLAYRGATSVKINAAGQLDVNTPARIFQDDKPFSYQETGGQQVEITSGYQLETPSPDEVQRYGFKVEAYDHSKPLVIDPVTLVYSGFLGGADDDVALDIAVDGAGNAYVTGMTTSAETSFPATAGPDLTFNGGPADAFIAKVDATSTALSYLGYVGGTGYDIAYAIAVDGGGNAYIAGSTTSSEATFPITVGPDLTYNGGSMAGDAFVAKINPSGTALVYCGYIGGAGDDVGLGIAADAAGNAYVTGQTGSQEATFPVKNGPDTTYNGGELDAFVAKVEATGASLDYAGYIGGSSSDQGLGIAVDSSGNAYISGATDSSEATFPVHVGPSLVHKGRSDAFIAKVNASGKKLIYSGYIGGAGEDVGARIAVDATGNAYITGATSSTEATFPVKVGPDLTYNGDGITAGDAFVAKLSPSGSDIIYCGYIGGAGGDAGLAIAVDDSGSAYVAGSTASSSASFAVNQGPSLTYNGGILFGDGFVAKVKADGTGLDFAGYMGGSADDIVTGIALDHAGNLYISGATTSAASSFPVAVGPRMTSGGLQDAFVAKITISSSGGGGSGPLITRVSRQGKNLLVEGSNFDTGAVILLNGEKQKTIHDDQNPTTRLTGKKLAKRAQSGDKLKVRNSDGSESSEWTYAP